MGLGKYILSWANLDIHPPMKPDGPSICLDNLPTELKMMILERLPRVRDVVRTSFVSRSFNKAYNDHKLLIIRNVLQSEFDIKTLQVAYAVHRAREIIRSPTNFKPEAICSGYLCTRHSSNLAWLEKPEAVVGAMSLESVCSTVCFHYRVVNPLLQRYHPLHPEKLLVRLLKGFLLRRTIWKTWCARAGLDPDESALKPLKPYQTSRLTKVLYDIYARHIVFSHPDKAILMPCRASDAGHSKLLRPYYKALDRKKFMAAVSSVRFVMLDGLLNG
ncbi:MAG: hypothetical protein Q9227_005524 [Pyrenula ochraceoflavens]